MDRILSAMKAMALILIVLLAVGIFLVRRAMALPLGEAYERVTAGNAVLIDVREPSEWQNGVAEPAVLLSLSDLRGARTGWTEFLAANKDKELILYCRSGNRSGIAAGILRKEGFRVENAGGFSRWKSAGLPVRQP
ncbi:MAG: rhodanese-like domain-containing protein [Terrimicrobiaceae bacterium]|nr:rhodanese-like domain-containing protein [Terrimicrobiaceae bacterium]